jgi:hypothetical protein
VKNPVEWQVFLSELALLYLFEVEADSLSVPGNFDRAQIQQVLINLLKNASESGGPADQVRMKVEVDDELTISVLDRGSGMKAEHLARAGEPFFTTKRTGTGIGLHLCREIAVAHGGTFQLTPRSGGGIQPASVFRASSQMLLVAPVDHEGAQQREQHRARHRMEELPFDPAYSAQRGLEGPAAALNYGRGPRPQSRVKATRRRGRRPLNVAGGAGSSEP